MVDVISQVYIHNYPIYYSGWWYTYPSGKYESQLGWLFPMYGKMEKVWNHQPEYEISEIQWSIDVYQDL